MKAIVINSQALNQAVKMLPNNKPKVLNHISAQHKHGSPEKRSFSGFRDFSTLTAVQDN